MSGLLSTPPEASLAEAYHCRVGRRAAQRLHHERVGDVHGKGPGPRLLEGAFMVRRLQPFFANVQKRLTKSPKIYVRDTGLLHHLAGLRHPRELATWPRRGNSFEGLVVEELAALAARRLTRPELFFWRTQAGAEVDLLIVEGRKILPVEIRLGASVDRYGLAGLRQCMNDLGLRRAWVVASAGEARHLAPGIDLVPWERVAAGSVDLF